MEKAQRLEECVSYFKERSVYRKLFAKVRDKYASLGHFGGKVTLSGLSPEEKSQLGGFFQKDYAENKSVTISAELMARALAESKFSEVSWTEILTAYYQEGLTVRKEVVQQEWEEREKFFEQIFQEYGKEPGKSWIQKVLTEHTMGYQILMQQYKENPAELRETLRLCMEGIAQLPVFSAPESEKNRELMPVFAARVSGNPHYYDEGTIGEKLLIYFLRELFEKEMEDGLTRVEEKSSLLYRAGILKDDLSNDTLVYGIHAVKTDGNIHEGMEGFLRAREPVKLTLRTIGALRKACAQGKENIVYVLENPAAFSLCIQENPYCSAICGNGQPRLATLVLMDLLKDSAVFYYAGDFDPEGLLIAQRLKLRYGQKLKLWNYRADWYERYLSPVKLGEKRLKQLEKVQLEELQEVKEAIYRKKRAAYQEAMMEAAAFDLRATLTVFGANTTQSGACRLQE